MTTVVLVILIQSNQLATWHSIFIKLETYNFPRECLLICQRSASRGLLFFTPWQLLRAWQSPSTRDEHGRQLLILERASLQCIFWNAKNYSIKVGSIRNIYIYIICYVVCMDVYIHTHIAFVSLISIVSEFTAQELAIHGCSTPIRSNCMFVNLVVVCTEGICNKMKCLSEWYSC